MKQQPAELAEAAESGCEGPVLLLGIQLPQRRERVSKQVSLGWNSYQHVAGVWSSDLLAFPFDWPMGKEWDADVAMPQLPQLRAWVVAAQPEHRPHPQHSWRSHPRSWEAAVCAQHTQHPEKAQERTVTKTAVTPLIPERAAVNSAPLPNPRQDKPMVNPLWFSDSTTLWREDKEVRSRPVYIR